MPNADLHTWLHHWQDEYDAAFLYLVLAGQEADPHRKDVYIKLAGVEERHVQMWEKLLAEHGHRVDRPRPSLNARVRAWVGQRFGSRYLLPLLLREEGQEVKGYLNLHKESREEDARQVSLQLAKESAAHAETLAELAGKKAEPWHRTESGGFLRNVVYGFNDGLTANFGLVAGVIGAAVQPHVIMISGVAGMIADALSMGASGYLAAKSEQEVYAHEIAMEKEEIRLMPDVEEEELALVYEAKGIEGKRARAMAAEVMRDPVRALDEQVREELKIGEAHSTPLKEGWITGVATAVGAFIPVAPFLILSGRTAMWTSFAVAMLSHFAVGGARSIFTGRGILRSGLDMFAVGLGVAVVGYAVGDLVAKVL
ncbi:MAG TPA: VIT1/CCC1 transporter family protein [Gemmatimonadales bacterium]|jgi:VIT1/CCC1 family predicted Fe2+/Mn2+ transporter|nr:VIT1/CCC1 transporter family protein [Gemmatimonadales bacterium]